MYLSIPLVVRIDVEIVACNDHETRQHKLQQTRHVNVLITGSRIHLMLHYINLAAKPHLPPAAKQPIS